MEPIKKNNYYQFPTISVATKTGKNTLCTIFCGIVKFNANKDIFKPLDAPEEIENIANRLKEDYSDNSIITDNVKGFIVLQAGHENGKISFKDATFIMAGKNMGKANQTNVWTQTLAQAKSKYAKKNRANDAPELFRPMLAHGDAVSADLLDSTLYELHDKHAGNYVVQYKYDGHRMVCRLSDQFCYTRTAEQTHVSNIVLHELSIIAEHIRSALPAYKNYDVHLDGEYYCHGMSLQSVSSAVRSEDQSEDKDRLLYYIFDVPITKDNKILPVKCKARMQSIMLLNKYFAHMNFTHIVFVQTWQPKSAIVLKILYLKAIKEQYEGLVMKISDEIYEPGHNNYHSKNMIKLKEKLREEFYIISYKTGVGKAEGKIIIQCELTEDTITKAVDYFRRKGKLYTNCPNSARGNRFWVKPAMTDIESEELYKKVLNDEITIIGRLYTVEFHDWSDKFIPTQPVGVEFYDNKTL
jgi:ATP-dependent DNA ligase